MVASITVSGTIGTPDERISELLEGTGVGDYFSASTLRAFLEGEAKDATEIEITIDSRGGDVAEGFEMYDMIKALSASKKVTTIAKRADSIASVIFLAGNVRKAVKGASFVIHNAWLSPADLNPDMMLNASTLDRIKRVNQIADSQILAVYAEVAGRDTAERLAELMERETGLSAEQLVALNFATEIISGEASKALRPIAFNSAVLALQDGPIITYADSVLVKDGRVLLIQRPDNDEFEGGKWAFPGGKVMQGETTLEGAVRELQEETGIEAELTHIGEYSNDDESLSHYFIGEVSVDPQITEEAQAFKWVTKEEALTLPLILDSQLRYSEIIEMAMKSEERISAMERAVNALKAWVKGSVKAMSVTLADGAQIFVYSEDGEFEGKKAVLMENGEPTETPAPAGSHALQDGREIVVGEGGIIQEVKEATAGMSEEEMQALIAQKEQEMAAAMEEEKKQLAAAYEEKEKALRAEFSEQLEKVTNELAEIKAMVPGEKPKAKAATDSEEWAKMTPSQRLAAKSKAQFVNK